MAALALTATSGWAPPPAGASARAAAHRVRRRVCHLPHASIFAHAPVDAHGAARLHVLADGPGHAGFERAVEEHARPWMWPEDHIRALRVDELLLAIEYLEESTRCATRMATPTSSSLLAPDLLPDVDHLIVLDPDTVVLADIAPSGRNFRSLGRAIFSMAVDQSDCYYHRLQDPADEVYSEGWAACRTLGVNGGVIPLRAAAARNANFRPGGERHAPRRGAARGRPPRSVLRAGRAGHAQLHAGAAAGPVAAARLQLELHGDRARRPPPRDRPAPRRLVLRRPPRRDARRAGRRGRRPAPPSRGERVRLLHFVGGTRGHRPSPRSTSRSGTRRSTSCAPSPRSAAAAPTAGRSARAAARGMGGRPEETKPRRRVRGRARVEPKRVLESFATFSLSATHLRRDVVRHHVRLPHVEEEAVGALEALADHHQLGNARAHLRRVVLVRLTAPRRAPLEDACAPSRRPRCPSSRATLRG